VIYLLIVVYFALSAPGAEADTVLQWRREYNQIAASIDTLSRLNSDQNFAELMRLQGDVFQRNFELVLVFWADDEAEVFINDFRVGQTRLTPTQVEIPSLYLREKNTIQVHCWDTDKVESGFMAGLYLKDATGGMRPVLVTEEGPWRSGGALAEVRYYAHSQPDIPGAEVIWGEGLFGEVWLEAEFTARQLERANRRQKVDLPPAQQQNMDIHEVASRLVQLQARQKELGGRLQRAQPNIDIPRYKGYVSGRLAFTLGRAGRLAEKENSAIAERLHEWADELPAVERELVFRPPRQLKGAQAAVEAKDFTASGSDKVERKKDYLPPPERKSGAGQKRESIETSVVFVAGLPGMDWTLWGALVVLVCYGLVSGHRWWLLFKAEEWKR
jgi:hypothetical protein